MATTETAGGAKKHELRGAAKKEAFHREAESRMVPFVFEPPEDVPDDAKILCHLARSDLLRASIQVIPEGGDNNLHYHPGADGFWMPLEGRVRFHGPDGVVGEFGPNEGIVIPRNARYWFETADPEQELHLLHISAHTQQKVANSRINVDPPNDGYKKAVRINYPDQ